MCYGPNGEAVATQPRFTHFTGATLGMLPLRVSKFNESAKNDVNLHMVLYRLPQFTTDILVTFNDPVNVK
nr:hypothetical protein BaRGS_029605 [Batillaria attramentaria]